VSDLGANTDLLNGEKLRPAHRKILEVIDRFNAVRGASMPLGPERGEFDKQINRLLTESGPLVAAIFTGLSQITEGDITNVRSLRDLFDALEATNTDLAAGDDRHRRP